jgi:hypothetical protein
MSRIDRPSDFAPAPSAREQRILMRALGCGVEEFVARVGAAKAIKRVETELRRAKRARSRKLYTLWSVVFLRIETETSARHMATRHADDAQAQD